MMRSRYIQWLLVTLAAALYIYLPVWSVGHGLSNNDFKHIYLGMKALLDGNSPYPIQSLHHQAALQGYSQISLNPYVYLPFTGYAMAFLAPFPLHLAVWVWFGINHLFAIGCIGIMCQWFSQWRVGAAAILLLVFAFNVPFYRTLSAGQLNMPLLFMLTLGFCLLQKQRDSMAGGLLAFATLFKLMPGIYGLYFLLTGRWKALRAFVIAGAAMAIASTLGAGWAITAEFFPVLRQMSYGKSTWPWAFSFWDDPANQSLNSFFSHIFTVSEHTTPWLPAGQGIANACTLVCTITLIILWVVAILKWGKVSPHLPRSPESEFSDSAQAGWCSTLILGLLVPSLMWDHYLVMLILPASWMVITAVRRKYYFTAGIIALAFTLTAIPWNYDSLFWRSGPGIIFMSFKLWPTLLLYGLSLCFIKWCNEEIAKSAGSNNISGLPIEENF